MTINKYLEMLERFEQYYPYWYKEMVDWWPSGRRSITIKLEDGSLLDYSPYEGTVRRIRINDYTTDVETLRKEIGCNIQKIVQARGIPQAEIARRCGITEAMMSRYIHGTSLPSIDKVHALATVLSCRVVDILGEPYDEEYIR